MQCGDCRTQTVVFAVPPADQEFVPGGESAVGFCPHCLALQPADSSAVSDEPDFARVSDAFPTEPDAAVPMALLVGLLDSLALYRSEIATLLARVERAGVDPLLVLDRLAADEHIETDLDIAGRRRQLEQLL
jgi:hypothetical protein